MFWLTFADDLVATVLSTESQPLPKTMPICLALLIQVIVIEVTLISARVICVKVCPKVRRNIWLSFQAWHWRKKILPQTWTGIRRGSVQSTVPYLRFNGLKMFKLTFAFYLRDTEREMLHQLNDNKSWIEWTLVQFIVLEGIFYFSNS